jgi:hypothetical protein
VDLKNVVTFDKLETRDKKVAALKVCRLFCVYCPSVMGLLFFFNFFSTWAFCLVRDLDETDEFLWFNKRSS